VHGTQRTAKGAPRGWGSGGAGPARGRSRPWGTTHAARRGGRGVAKGARDAGPLLHITRSRQRGSSPLSGVTQGTCGPHPRKQHLTMMVEGKWFTYFYKKLLPWCDSFLRTTPNITTDTQTKACASSLRHDADLDRTVALTPAPSAQLEVGSRRHRRHWHVSLRLPFLQELARASHTGVTAAPSLRRLTLPLAEPPSRWSRPSPHASSSLSRARVQPHGPPAAGTRLDGPRATCPPSACAVDP
jgi:hypothetical protein